MSHPLLNSTGRDFGISSKTHLKQGSGHVRYRSKGDIGLRPSYVSLTPESGHRLLQRPRLQWATSGNDARSPILPYRTVDESRSEHNGSALPQTPLSEVTKKVVSDVAARAVRSSFVKRKWRCRMVRIGA